MISFNAICAIQESSFILRQVKCKHIITRVNVLAKSAPGGGGNKFNLGKNREEIQLEKTNDKLSTFLYFMDIFPVFDEFLP